MIVYHGTPFGGESQGVTRFLKGRHALIPFNRQDDIAAAMDVCQTFVTDCSAYTAWNQGAPILDWTPYYDWVRDIHRHPAFAWAIIPDVIDGTEEDNDALLNDWDDLVEGVPVWHMHESMDRLKRLVTAYRRICLGSSAEFSQTGTKRWWGRIIEAMDVICDENGRPMTKLHGLRMAAREYTSRIPFSSVDSTNVAQNSSLIPRFGMYKAPQRWQRAEAIAYIMEACETTGAWDRNAWKCTEGVQLFNDGHYE
jgi:hypothetical protein